MSADSFPAPSAPASDRDVRTPGRRSPALAAGLRLTRWTVLAAMCLIVAVSLLRRTELIHVYYWIDEGLSVGIASHPLAHIPGLMRQDGSPPLYYLILHVWMAAFGHGVVATHVLSLLFATAAIPTAYWAGASLFDRRTGLICAVLAAGSPYLTSYSEETRMYAFMALLSIVVAASFVHAFVRRRPRAIPAFVVSLTAALYTHNWGLFLGAMCGVAYLWCLWSQTERRAMVRDGAIAFGAVALLFLPWVPTLLFQARHTGAPWDLPPVVWSLSQGLYFLVGGRGVAMLILLAGGAGLFTLRARPQLAAAWTNGHGAANGHVATNGHGPAHGRFAPGVDRGWERLAVESLLIVGLGTLLLAWLYAKTTPAWAPRYLAVIVGPLLLAAGTGLARAGRLGLVALALAVCFWLVDPLPTALSAKSNVAPVAAQIRPHLGSDPLVLATQPEEIPVLANYLPSVRHFGTPLGRVPDPHIVDWRDILARFERSSVHGVLSPLLAGLHPGQRVALVVPIKFSTAPLYMKLIHRASDRWLYALSHDRQLRFITTSDAQWSHAGVPVQAYVYEVR
jgi:mannosyltransferase